MRLPSMLKFFFSSDAKFKPAATHALAHTTKEVGGRSSPGPADAVGNNPENRGV
jgi:hypothetical protein